MKIEPEHAFDEGSVLNPATGKPYGPGPLWAGAEPMDYPDPMCVCGELWGEDDRCSADPAARPETSVKPCPSVSPVRDIQCSFSSGHGPLDGADDKFWNHGNRDRNAWWTENGPRAVVLSDADYEAAVAAGEIHKRPGACPRCGGLEGTHTRRNCEEESHA